MADGVANSIIWNFSQISSPLATDAEWTTLNPELKKGQFVFALVGSEVGLKIAKNDGDLYNDLLFSFLGTQAPQNFEYDGSDVVDGVLEVTWGADKVLSLGSKPIVTILLDGSTGDSPLKYIFLDYPVVSPTTLRIEGIGSSVSKIYIKAQS